MTPRRCILLLAAAGMVAVACFADDPQPSTTGSPALNATSADLLPETVDSLPDVDLEDYERLLAQLRGTPVVVNVWASWCIPCKAEAPLLVDAARRYGAQVQFVGLDVQDSRNSALDYIASFGLPFPTLFDPPLAIGTHLGLLGPPGTFFYDREGKLVGAVRGQLSAQALAQGIDRIRD